MTTLYTSSYDPNTKLTSNSQMESTVPVIPVDNLTSSTPAITLPTPTSSTPDLSIPTTPISTPTIDAQIQKTLDTPITIPSSADAYAQAQQQSGIQEKQQVVNDLSSQINTINANAQAAQQTLESQSAGKDVTSAFLGKQQQEITRQANIKSLPLTAQLQAAQGNLTSAQSSLETLFKLKSDDATNKYNALKDQRTAVLGYLSDKQKAQVETQQKIDDRTFELQKLNIAKQNDLALQAIKSGQGSLVSQINGLDPASKTFDTDIARLSGQISAETTAKAPTIQKINGVDMQWNPTTAKWDAINGTQATPALQLAQAQGNISEISNILKSGGMKSTVGTSFLTRSPQGFWGSLGAIASVIGIPSFINGVYKNMTGEKQNFISGVQQLQSTLSLDSLIQAKAKGATFGALSDTEMGILSKSATKLGTWAVHSNESDPSSPVIGYNATEKDFKSELDKINNYAKLDYLLKGGNAADIGATKMPDGTFTTVNSDGTITILNNL